jgi:hypothetical protein
METSTPGEEIDKFRIVVVLCCVWVQDFQLISNNTWFLLNSSAGILEQSMGARNRVGTELSFRPHRLRHLAESIPWLLKSLKILSLESIFPPINR